MNALATKTQINNTTRLNLDSVYHQINIFLNNRAKRSINTAKKYEKDIRYFFRYVRDKELNELIPEDLKVTKAEVMDCQTYYANKYKNKSTDDRFTALASLYNFLEDKYDVKKSVFKIDKLPDDSKKIGVLSLDEVQHLANLTFYEANKREEKRAFFITSIALGWRLEMLLNIRLDDIRVDEKNPSEVIVEPEFRDKGKQVKKNLHIEWYNMILDICDGRDKNEKIFTLTKDEIYGMFNRLLSKANIDPRRRISPHSLRKTSANLEYLFTNGDIFAVTRHGNWSSSDIVFKHYAEEKKSVTGILLFENIDDGVFDELTKDDLLNLIHGLPTEYKIQLKRKAKEILEVKG